MSDEIFIKILNNSASEAEKSDFYQSLEKDSVLSESYHQYKNLFAVSAIGDLKYSDLHKTSFERFWNRVSPVEEFRIFKFWYRYAAVFVIALALGFLLRHLLPERTDKQSFAMQIEYTSEKGSVSTIHLEDGSDIWLSSASKLILHKNSKGEMSAKLDGEAYFDLVPDQSRKLTVDLGNFKIKDIGTKFNIRAYNAEADVYTTLVNGQIDLFDSSEKPLLSMRPGEYLQYNKESNRMAVSQRDPTIATAWKDGKFVFIDKTLGEICKELENWYNVEIIISNKSLANSRYTSVIKRTTTVSMVLKMLSLTDRINYKITDRKEARDIITIY